ncbi:hypothetical protein VTJ83DRAFT_114 [Remersonia thermophila]|uniref:Uncharacterized protein n=1 Tax=Remersonia thermophila TaxID=72144 RepID=A0ABR4DK54_9PEZI
MQEPSLSDRTDVRASPSASAHDSAGGPIDFLCPARPVHRGRSLSHGSSSSESPVPSSHPGSSGPALSPAHSAQPPPELDRARTPDPPALLPPGPTMPHTASQRGGKARSTTAVAVTPHGASSPTDRSSRVLGVTPTSSSTAESPSSVTVGGAMPAPPATRKRSRTLDAADDAGVDENGHSKGGHALRKRARVDYTQEMIEDDLGFPAARVAPAAKTASTPGSRGRKKRTGGQDDSEEESDDGSSVSLRRHSIDKSPVPSRTMSARRRNTAKKLSVDLTHDADHASDDNPVRDTILVSVPADLTARSEPSSSPNPPAGPGDSPARTPPPRYPLPLERRASASNDLQSVGNHDGEAQVASDALPGAADAPRLPSEPASFPKRPELENDDPEADQPAHVNGQAPARPASPPVPFQADRQESDAIPDAVPASQVETHQRDDGPASVEDSPSTKSLTPALATVKDSVEPHVLHHSPRQATVSPSPSRQDQRSSGPSRFRRLEPIYKSETPFASRLNLTPYESDDVLLPGPYTEWVYPAASTNPYAAGNGASSRATSPPAMLPLEKAAEEIRWDMHRPIKMKEFARMYYQDRRRRKLAGEKLLSLWEYNNFVVKQWKEFHNGDLDAADSNGGAASPGRTSEEGPLHDNEEVIPEPKQSLPADSAVPTAAPSPAPADDAAPEEGEEQEADEAMADNDTRPATPAEPIEPVEVTRLPTTQFSFPRLRDPKDLAAELEEFGDLSTPELYEKAAAAVEVLHKYEKEYRELRKMLDDEENAKRRQANDKTIINWENRQRSDEPQFYRRHFDDAVKGPPPFEVRGVRAPKPYFDDACLEHQKSEDRIMAQAYGFKLDTHPARVGKQDPEEQRWEMPENRLRKRTEKGAELAEDNVVEGKRTRKPRNISDQSKDVSRSATPAMPPTFGPARRPRRKATASTNAAISAALNGGGEEDGDLVQAAEAVPEPIRTRRAARGRGVAQEDEKPTSMPPGFGGALGKGMGGLPANEDSRPSTATSQDSAESSESIGSAYSLREKRKRNFALENDPGLETRPKRRATSQAKAPQQAEMPEPVAASPKKKRGPKKKEPSAQQPFLASIASAVPHAATQPPPPPLPPQQPEAKFYNFVPAPVAAEANSGSVHSLPAQGGPFVHTFNAAPAFPPGVPPPPPPPPAVKKPLTKIKFTNNGASSSAPAAVPTAASPHPTSRASTPGSTAGSTNKAAPKRVRNKKGADGPASALSNGDGDMDKPYSEMTKSEKMSWSMRRRWASGEMQGAVEKRRTTLANKKAERAAGNINNNNNSSSSNGNSRGGGNRAASEATSSGPATPAATLLALPRGQPTPPPMPPSSSGVAVLKAPQQPPVPSQGGGFLQQPLPPPPPGAYPYALPPPAPGTGAGSPWAG